MRRAARQDLVSEDAEVFCRDDRLEQRGHALAPDDVPKLARQLLLALLLGIAHGIRRGLHALIDLPFEPDLRPVIDAGDADEESDLLLLHRRETQPHGVDQFLPQIVGHRVEGALLSKVAAPSLEEDEEARSAAQIRRHDPVWEAGVSL